MRCWRLICFFAFSLFASSSLAQSGTLELSKNRTWQRLVHYEPLLFGGYRSSARSFDFFLAKDGKRNPQHELEATIDSLFHSQAKIENRCRYPARYEWLKAELKISESDTLDQCKELSEWKHNLDAKSLSLVHPESSLESSISVFSHTFLKINSRRYEPQSRLHSSISFAASFNAKDNIAKLAILGVFGGYDGKYGTDYYYEDMIRYGVRESRDIFEYDLSLSPQEVDQVLNHIWETKNTKFDYLFLSKNCSYFLLSLIEVGRPSLDISARFRYLALPIDTVKAVESEPGLVAKIRYIPSRQRVNQQRLLRLSQSANSLYYQIIDKPDHIRIWSEISGGLSHEEKAGVLDSLINTWTDNRYSDFTDERRIALQLRSKELSLIDVAGEFKPESYPHQFHGSHLGGFTFASRSEEKNIFPMLRYRFVFHDILNDDQGAVRDTTVEAFDFEAQYLNSELSIYRTTLFNILSLQPWNLNGNNSWMFRSRWQEGIFENRGGIGYSFFKGSFRGYIMAVAQSENQNILATTLFAGPEIGGVIELNARFNSQADLGYLYALTRDQENQMFASAVLNFKQTKNQEFRLIYEKRYSETQVKLSALTYF